MDTCKDCRFFCLGNCRAHPPVVMSRTTEYGPVFDSAWPEVGANHWCGEFQPKQQEE